MNSRNPITHVFFHCSGKMTLIARHQIIRVSGLGAFGKQIVVGVAFEVGAAEHVLVLGKDCFGQAWLDAA